MFTPRLFLWTFAALLVSGFVSLGATGWPGEFVGAAGMFCEAFDDDWIRQPANTWSNLGFVAAGLWMATHPSTGSATPTSSANPFSRSRAMPIVFAALVIFIGPGSMALHASGHAWGHTLDVLAMLVFITFPIAWAAARLMRGGERTFWRIYLPLTLTLAIPHTLGILPFSGIVLYVVLVPVALSLEIALQLTGRGCARRAGYALAATTFFALALVFWGLSLTDAPLCDPHSLLQGHAAWHLLCAAATVCLFLAYANERIEEPAR